MKNLVSLLLFSVISFSINAQAALVRFTNQDALLKALQSDELLELRNDGTLSGNLVFTKISEVANLGSQQSFFVVLGFAKDKTSKAPNCEIQFEIAAQRDTDAPHGIASNKLVIQEIDIDHEHCGQQSSQSTQSPVTGFESLSLEQLNQVREVLVKGIEVKEQNEALVRMYNSDSDEDPSLGIAKIKLSQVEKIIALKKAEKAQR